MRLPALLASQKHVLPTAPPLLHHIVLTSSLSLITVGLLWAQAPSVSTAHASTLTLIYFLPLSGSVLANCPLVCHVSERIHVHERLSRPPRHPLSHPSPRMKRRKAHLYILLLFPTPSLSSCSCTPPRVPHSRRQRREISAAAATPIWAWGGGDRQEWDWWGLPCVELRRGLLLSRARATG